MRRDPRVFLLGVGVLVLMSWGCRPPKVESPLVCIAQACYTVDIARTPEDRERGLMFRDGLAQGQGMLFVFDESGVYPFWMKNMTFAIDILWIDENKKVVRVASRVPPCTQDPCPVYDPGVSAKYVLEIPAGDAARQPITVQSYVRF